MLSGNELTVVVPGALQGLPALATLFATLLIHHTSRDARSLQNNNITALTTGVFDGAPNLQALCDASLPIDD